MNTPLSGQVVVITGASGGIGSAIAKQFTAEGAKLTLHYRSGKARVAALQRELGNAESLVVRADLTDESQAKQLFAQTVKRFGRVDTLIANAGWWETRYVPLHQMPLEQWRRTIEGVLTTTFLSVREFLRLVARQKRGNAVLIASTAAVFGEAGHADYASGKAAIAYGLTRSLKNEISHLAPHTGTYCGGRIKFIFPGGSEVPGHPPRVSAGPPPRQDPSTQ